VDALAVVFGKGGHLKFKAGADLTSDALPFGRLLYAGLNAASNAIGYAKLYSRSHASFVLVPIKGENCSLKRSDSLSAAE
jgi:hypothetical protein